jgi:glucose-6-phosphate isomerase
MANAQSARTWLAEKLGPGAVALHFAAATANATEAVAFGVQMDYTFRFWDWVGGRYSLWSVVGLPLMIAIEPGLFREFLAGGAAMDRHFLEAPLHRNLPVLLGLIQIWHRNLWGYAAQAILPYAQDLALLPAYLQQLEMESNGKSVSLAGKPLGHATAPIVWGSAGTNGQHAFHQWLHQGSEPIPSDFILVARDKSRFPEQHDMLAANALAQSAALAFGRSESEAAGELRRKGHEASAVASLAPHLVCPGNRPSSTILLPELDPYHLGALIALYEHKVFVAGALWGVNSFDQWGVELGKDIARSILDGTGVAADSSTAGLKAIYDALVRRG